MQDVKRSLRWTHEKYEELMKGVSTGLQRATEQLQGLDKI